MPVNNAIGGRSVVARPCARALLDQFDDDKVVSRGELLGLVQLVAEEEAKVESAARVAHSVDFFHLKFLSGGVPPNNRFQPIHSGRLSPASVLG